VSDEVLSASGVLLFFTCADGAVPRPCTAADPRGAGGSLTVDDNGSLRLLGGLPSGDPDFADRSFSIIYDRNNTAPLTLDGDEHRVVITDDVYLPSAVLRTVGAVDLADVVARTVSAGEGSLRAGTTNPVTSTVTEPAPPSLTK
jgi:hypothetical protein